MPPVIKKPAALKQPPRESKSLKHDAPQRKRVVLVTFDIDGTICRSVGAQANRLHKDAFAHAFRSIFGLEASVDDVPHHGSTDPLILLKVLAHRGLAVEEVQTRLGDMKETMASYVNARTSDAGEGLELLPGVEELLRALGKLESEGVRVGLVTGNLEPIAWVKMTALGVAGHFSSPRFGGFGSDACGLDFSSTGAAADRTSMVRLAADRARALFGDPLAAHFHIGDAPADVQAAAAAGAVPVGVCTGVFGREELERCLHGVAPSLLAAPSAPDRACGVVLDSLADTSAALAALGLTRVAH